jgi:NAD(P)-dependent dehydrogenase (short-subunit alcohol dehydrogenase family)
MKEGAYVFITGRRQAELDSAVSLIGKNVTAIQGDVSNLDDLDHLYEVVRKVKGCVDVVFANAGAVDPVWRMVKILECAEGTAVFYDGD